MAAPPSLLTPRTTEQLAKAAGSEVESEIQGAVSPIESQIGTLQTDRDRAVAGIKSLFGTIQPSVEASATQVQQVYNEAQTKQQQIFAEATRRMNEARQGRAASAQALAQQIGGPVAVGEFTEGVDPHAESLANFAAGDMLHTNLFAQAGVQQAQAFAGRVFPLLRTEEEARARTTFENQIKTLRDQITTLKGSKTSKVNARLNDLQIKEREFALQKAQQGLDRLKGERDWKATLRTLKNDEIRLELAQKQFALETGKAVGIVDGKPTLEAKALTVQQKQQAASLGMSEKEYQLRLRELNTQTKLANDRLKAANQSTWAQYLDAAVNPQPGKTITVSSAVPVPETAAITGKVKDAYPDPNSPTGYSRIVKTEQTAITDPITEPADLVDYLIAHNVPKTIAVRMVKNRLKLPADWVYGEGVGPTRRNQVWDLKKKKWVARPRGGK